MTVQHSWGSSGRKSLGVLSLVGEGDGEDFYGAIAEDGVLEGAYPIPPPRKDDSTFRVVAPRITEGQDDVLVGSALDPFFPIVVPYPELLDLFSGFDGEEKFAFQRQDEVHGFWNVFESRNGFSVRGHCFLYRAEAFEDFARIESCLVVETAVVHLQGSRYVLSGDVEVVLQDMRSKPDVGFDVLDSFARDGHRLDAFGVPFRDDLHESLSVASSDGVDESGFDTDDGEDEEGVYAQFHPVLERASDDSQRLVGGDVVFFADPFGKFLVFCRNDFGDGFGFGSGNGIFLFADDGRYLADCRDGKGFDFCLCVCPDFGIFRERRQGYYVSLGDGDGRLRENHGKKILGNEGDSCGKAEEGDGDA